METQKKKKDNFFLNISFNLIIPFTIWNKFANEEYLGTNFGFAVALVFPIGYGIYDYLKKRKFNFFSALGFISILLTGGIGLLKLSREWMIAKETGIPFLMGIAVLVSNFTKYPLVKTFFNEMLRLEDIDKAFEDNGHPDLFEEKLRSSSYLLVVTFMISAFLNYYLAVKILVGEPGTEEFNKSLSEMTLWSFPVITIPMMIMTGFILFNLFNSIKKYTKLEIEELFRQ